MVGRCLRVYDHVRQITLMSDDEPRVVTFYESLGFATTGDLGLVAYVRLAD